MDFKIKHLITLFFLLGLKNIYCQNLAFNKPITLQKVWCGGVNNTCNTVSGYSYPKSDTVPTGKIWKIEFIGHAGELIPHIYINDKEIAAWQTSSPNIIWMSNNAIWLNSGDIISTGAENGSVWNRNAFGTITINLIEFNSQ